MNLSEVHSLSPAFPDVGGGGLGAAARGGVNSNGADQTKENKK